MTIYGPGRRYPTHTKLGKVMELRGVTANVTAGTAGVHFRTLTEYLAGRDRIRPHHVARLCEFLECDAEDIVE